MSFEKRWCPKCGEEAEIVCPYFLYAESSAGLSLIYWVCWKCGLFHIDRNVAKRMIKSWIEDSVYKHNKVDRKWLAHRVLIDLLAQANEYQRGTHGRKSRVFLKTPKP